MKKVVKWFGIGFGGFILAVLLAALSLFLVGGTNSSRSYDLVPDGLTIPTDDASVARGKHLIEAITPCTECHADDLSGDVIVDESGIATIYASNLTSGIGGVASRYNDEDWVRAIRHGVDETGEGMWIMPSEYWNFIGDDDLAAMVAYIKTLPPVDNTVPDRSLGVVGRILVAAGLFGELIPAQLIEHNASRVAIPAPGPTAEYGGYIVSIAGCTLCHGDDLGGGSTPDNVVAPNISSSGTAGTWTVAQFMQTLRTGETPGGASLDNEQMPWGIFGNMTDDELTAVFLYLQTQ